MHNARKENLVSPRYRSAAALSTPDFARRLKAVLEDSGGMFVKFGQIASTRTDLLPTTLTDELETLQSDVRPEPPEAIRTQLERELNEPVEKAFASFTTEPLAAASIGQTHRATLQDGNKVVVKVQRPGIDDLVDRDASVLAAVARQLDRRVTAAHRFGVKRLAERAHRRDRVRAQLHRRGHRGDDACGPTARRTRASTSRSCTRRCRPTASWSWTR